MLVALLRESEPLGVGRHLLRRDLMELLEWARAHPESVSEEGAE